MNMSDVFLSVHDNAGRYLKVCDNIKNVTGYEKSDVIGKSAYEFFHPKCVENILESHLSRSLSIVTYIILGKDGSPIYMNTISFKSVSAGSDLGDEIYCFNRKMSKLEVILYKINKKISEYVKSRN